MEKIIFFDIDGTLRDEVFGVPESARKAVEELREKGILVCICTGRTKATLPPDVSDIAVDYLIAGGGNYIEGNGRIIKQSYFNEDEVTELYEGLLEKKKTGVVMDGEHTLFMNETAVRTLKEDRREKKKQAQEIGAVNSLGEFGITYRENFKEFSMCREAVSKFCLWAEDDTMEEIKEYKLWKSSKLAQREVLKDGTGYYEMIQTGCSKGDAVTELCELLDIDKVHRLAFGDGMNDVDLFMEVGTAVAMESGKKDLFPYADTICGAPMEDGIYKELKRRKII